MSFDASPPTCIDLFAGCGGLSEGLLSVGLDVIASVELHPQPALTHAFNHADTTVFVGDVRAWNVSHIQSVRRGTEPIDLIAGGPPCQGFSSAGKKSVNDPRNSLFQVFAEIVEQTQPRMFLLENVPGFRTMFGGSVYRDALLTFKRLNYDTTDGTVVAADYGVPQTRKRFVMIGWRPGEADNFKLPAYSDSPRRVATGGYTCFSALHDIDFLAPGFEATRHMDHPDLCDYAKERRNGTHLLFNHLASRHRARAVEIMLSIPEGGTINRVDPSVRSAKRTMARLDRTRVSNTVLSLPDDMIHYRHDRILTVRENARLQTFDDDFVFFGKRTSGFVERRVDVPQYTQVGNAVPPLLARGLGRAILASLGSPERDLRNLAARRRRHRLVRGSSGYAGYLLDPSAAEEISLRTVSGQLMTLPIEDGEPLVIEQEPLREWTCSPKPKRGQWAPGVTPKDRPAWHADSASQ